MSKIKNGGLDQYGAERFEQQQFATDGAERFKCITVVLYVVFVAITADSQLLAVT